MISDSVLKQFLFLALHPEKGRVRIDSMRFRYALAGAYLMELLTRKEIKIEDKRINHSLRKNGEPVHDTIVEIFEKQKRPRRVRYWINRLSWKSRFIFRETMKYLSSSGLLRHEKHYFLGIIPVNRYFISDIRNQKDVVDKIRRVLLYNDSPSREVLMLVSLVRMTESEKLIAESKEERRLLRNKIKQLTDDKSGLIDPEVAEIQKAVLSAITAARSAAVTVAASG